MPSRLPVPQSTQIEARLRAHDAPKVIAEEEGIGLTTIYRFQRNIDAFDTMYAPRTAARGKPRQLTHAQVEALLEYLLNKPDAYQEEQRYWLWDQFGIDISQSTISRALKKHGYTRKKLKKRASEQCPQLREAWMARLTAWRPDQLVFIDESAANEHTKDRKYGWAPQGINARVFQSAKRSERWSILPAYTIRGIIAHYIYQGAYDAALFNWFIEEFILPQCNPYPGPRSVLIMDNASIHKSQV